MHDRSCRAQAATVRNSVITMPCITYHFRSSSAELGTGHFTTHSPIQDQETFINCERRMELRKESTHSNKLHVACSVASQRRQISQLLHFYPQQRALGLQCHSTHIVTELSPEQKASMVIDSLGQKGRVHAGNFNVLSSSSGQSSGRKSMRDPKNAFQHIFVCLFVTDDRAFIRLGYGLLLTCGPEAG